MGERSESSGNVAGRESLRVGAHKHHATLACAITFQLVPECLGLRVVTKALVDAGSALVLTRLSLFLLNSC